LTVVGGCCFAILRSTKLSEYSQGWYQIRHLDPPCCLADNRRQVKITMVSMIGFRHRRHTLCMPALNRNIFCNDYRRLAIQNLLLRHDKSSSIIQSSRDSHASEESSSSLSSSVLITSRLGQKHPMINFCLHQWDFPKLATTDSEMVVLSN
jgi:hypothetical protein